jgi:drug/metabolite transporter (DMT)-like permease
MTERTDRILPGVALMLAFCVTAPLLDVSAKLATETIPVGQITAARFVLQAAFTLPLALAFGMDWRLAPRTAALLALRAALLMVSTFCFVAAVRVMPVADALAIVFVEPMFLMLMGWAIFGDRVGPRRIAASIVGFGGAMLVIQPSLAIFGTVALYPLGTAVAFAAYMLVTRRLARDMEPVAMQVQTSLAGSLIAVPVLALAAGSGIAVLDPVWPEGRAWLWLAGVGFWAAVSHMMMTYALRFAPSATLAPLQYLEIPVAVVLGFLVFGDFPGPLTWAGILVITGAGLYIIHRERLAAQALRAPGAGRRAAG